MNFGSGFWLFMIARNVFPCVFYKHEVNTWQLVNS
nr:MAG TPA: hypothetical protein [Caudoviricetes sp.]